MKKFFFLGLLLFLITTGCQLPNILLEKALDQIKRVPTTCNDLQKLLLIPADLSGEREYILQSPDALRQVDNEDILEAWGDERGQDYLERTGRVVGCLVTYRRSSDDPTAPGWIRHNLVRFENPEGALTTINEYPRTLLNKEFTRFEERLDIGDGSYAYVRLERTENEQILAFYEIQTAYQNYVSIVTIWGNPMGIKYHTVETLARRVIAKIENQVSGKAGIQP